MNTTSLAEFRRRVFRALVFVAIITGFGVMTVRAGLTLELNVIRYHQYGYYFSPNLNTNSSALSVPFGDYYITSSGYPTNGSSALYHFDTNGFNQSGGSSWGYGDFDGMRHELTNATWSIFVTNSVTTNVYHFAVTANITSNDLPYVSITSPANGAVNVTNRPTFTWHGPTNYNNLVVYYFNNANTLPVTQTSLLSPTVLYLGMNNFTAHYDSNSTTAVVSSVPTNIASQPISSWVSTAHLQDYATCQFSVGTVDPSGTSHTLVARYAWDGTNLDGTASGVDTSGNGYDMNFGGNYGSQGGADSTATAAVGPRAIHFHNGDGGSAGYVGWNPTPTNLLSALAGSFSISCWIKTTQSNYGWDNAPADYGAGIVSADNGGLANDLVPLALTGNTLGFNTGGSTEDVTLNSVASVNDGNYHHIVVSRNQSTGQKIIYFDGVLDSFGSGSTNRLNDPQLLTIGALSDANNSDAAAAYYYNGYNGWLDDLQIYSGVLSSNEVANLFANPGSTTPDGGGPSSGHTNVAHYAFDDSANLGLDSSGNGNDAPGVSWWGPQHQFDADAEAGGGAVQFFGTSYLNPYDQPLTNLNAVLAGSFSFSAWVKTAVTNGADGNNAFDGAVIFWAYNDQGNTNDTIPLAITGNKAAFTTRDHLGDFNTLHSITSVNDGNYHLITTTRDHVTGEKKLYVDGNFETSEIGTTDPLNGNNYNLTIGGYAYVIDGTGTNYSSYRGRLDDVQIYSGVLSASEVAALYNNPGTTAPDASANGGALGDALNAPQLIWATSGNTSWFVETTNTHDNVSAARSGAITNDTQSSYLETSVTGPGTLSFWWQTAADDLDFETQFKIDGNYMNNIYGNTAWTQETYAIGPGQHTLRWVALAYAIIPDTDAGYLDEVSFEVANAPVITLNPFNQTNYSGYSVALLAGATSNVAITWQWFKVGSASPIPNATNALFIPTNSGTAGVAGNYFAIATNITGSATTAVATVTFQNAAQPQDWSSAFRSQLNGNGVDANTSINIACLLDSVGNIYTVGSVVGTNTFGSDTLISANGREGSTFLKQTATGTPIWGRCMTNNGYGFSFPRGIAAAPGDGFYAMGLFGGTNWLGTNKLVDTAGASTYLARFDANGSNLWVRTIVGTNVNFPTHHTLVSDPTGNVTLSTLIQGYTSFGTTNIYAPGQQGILVQYDLNGNVRWAQFPSAWPSYLTYSAGRIYGSMSGGLTNYIGGVTNVSDRRQALFSLNATNGQSLWVRGLAAEKDQGNPSGFGSDDALVAVSGTNVFVTGTSYGSNAVFGPFTNNYPAGTGQYFARYDTNGNAQLATSFGSQFTWPWATVADASGNVYVGADFDTYAIFGRNLIAAPFYETVQYVGSIDNRIPGQAFVAKFDRNGNPLWARSAQSPSKYLNVRDITLASDGVWASGFFEPIGNFGTNTIYGGITCVGSPFCTIIYHRGGYMAKITEASGSSALPVTLLNPQVPGSSFQFSFASQSGFTHWVLYRTNLATGNWLTNSSLPGDGTLKTVNVPLSAFGSARQGFVRVLTQ